MNIEQLSAAIASLIGKFSNGNLDRNISNSPSQLPYQEFNYTIDAGDKQTIYFVFRYFRILSITGTSNLKLRFGQNVNVTDFAGAGLGIELDETYDQVEITNNDASPVTLRVALAMGRVFDDRLSVSSTVSVSNVSPASFVSSADVAVSSLATTSVLAANTSRKEAFICNKNANGGIVKLSDSAGGASEGIEIPAGSTFIVSTTAQLYVYNPLGTTANIGVAYTQ